MLFEKEIENNKTYYDVVEAVVYNNLSKFSEIFRLQYMLMVILFSVLTKNRHKTDDSKQKTKLTSRNRNSQPIITYTERNPIPYYNFFFFYTIYILQ